MYAYLTLLLSRKKMDASKKSTAQSPTKSLIRLVMTASAEMAFKEIPKLMHALLSVERTKFFLSISNSVSASKALSKIQPPKFVKPIAALTKFMTEMYSLVAVEMAISETQQ